MEIVTVERKILEKNDEIAMENRRTFRSLGLFTLNMLSSPGSGKTTLLEKTLTRLKALASQLKVAVIEGDVSTDRDAQRIAECNVPVAQIITNGACHLEAPLVRDAAERLDLEDRNVLIIENVGNLVCPASFDLGEDMKVVLFSATEGDDKPLKYPKMFRVADVCIINKTDLLPYIDFDMQAAMENALKINPDLAIFPLSARTGEGLDEWIDWLQTQVVKNDSEQLTGPKLSERSFYNNM